MMIKLMLEEAGQYFYCEARKTATHDYEGIVHFLHKVGDGNAFVRGKTHHIKTMFDSRNDALTAAECHGKQISIKLARTRVSVDDDTCVESGAPNAVFTAASCLEKSAC